MTPLLARFRHFVAARSRVGLAVVMALALSAVTPAGAQTQEIEDTKSQREQTRAEAADRAAELDPLLTEDLELEAAVAALALHVSTQEAKLESTQQALATARDESKRSAGDVVSMTNSIADLRLRLGDRAVASYINPEAQRLDDYFVSSDLTVAAHKQALLDKVEGNDIDVLDQLRAAEDALVDLETAAAEAVEEVEAQELLEQAQLADLEDALAAEELLKAALEDRIAGVTAEIDALAARDAELTSLITDLIEEEEARVAAEEAARRWAEEQARIAAAQAEAANNSNNSNDSSGNNGDGDTPPPAPTAVPLPPPSTSGGMVWPTNGVVTSLFGPRWGRQHQGIDIAANTGTPIYAAQSGTVVNAGTLGGFGTMALIDHGDGFTTIYGHMSELYVSAGEYVNQGQTIGLMGCTGSCTGPHLHFETRVNGIPQDPMLYL